MGKAAGHDGVTPEMIKHMGKKGRELLSRMIKLAWESKRIPKEWEVAVILPAYKKGDNSMREPQRYFPT